MAINSIVKSIGDELDVLRSDPQIKKILGILNNSSSRKMVFNALLSTIKSKRINGNFIVNHLNENIFVILDTNKEYVIKYIDTYLPKYLKCISKLLEAYLSKKVSKDEFLFKTLPNFIYEFTGVYKMESLVKDSKEFNIDSKKEVKTKPLNESLIELIEFVHSHKDTIHGFLDGLKSSVQFLEKKNYAMASKVILDSLGDSNIKNKKFIALCNLGLNAVDLLGKMK